MSKVKIQGNASGTGVVTLTAPNTNTDRTITLPDGDISLGVGIDDNATSTAITIDASENVKLSTGGQFQFNNDTFRLRRDGSTGHYHIESDETGSSIIFGTDTGAGVVNHLTIDRYGRGLSQFTAKAWVKYDQINNTVDDSHNVSSVTDTAAGRYQVSFSNNMANTTYTAFVCINDRGGFGDDNFVTDTETTGSFFVRTKHQNAAGTAYAQDFVSSAVVFGD